LPPVFIELLQEHHVFAPFNIDEVLLNLSQVLNVLSHREDIFVLHYFSDSPSLEEGFKNNPRLFFILDCRKAFLSEVLTPPSRLDSNGAKV